MIVEVCKIQNNFSYVELLQYCAIVTGITLAYLLLVCVYIVLLISFLFLTTGKHSAQWALDDVFIGINDSSRNGFHEKFDGTSPLRHNWFRVLGGEVTVDCLSLDTALIFHSDLEDSKSALTTKSTCVLNSCNPGKDKLCYT